MMYGFGRFGYGLTHGATWMSWVAPIAMVLFWALFVAAMVLLIRYLVRHTRWTGHDSTAMAILRERYARGEIMKEEFEQKRKDLL
jgi:putative membrane protein